MSDLTFTSQGWDDYIYWQSKDKKVIKRINDLLKDISRNGNAGIGKPEPLRYEKSWSRRIDEKNRLVYRIEASGTIVIYSCKGHYIK